jgi:hypothetical protein
VRLKMRDDQIIVPDIASHQKDPRDIMHLDFSKMYHAGARGLLFRASCNMTPDLQLQLDYEHALKHELAVLHYHYLYWYNTPAEQMKTYLNYVKPLGLTSAYELDYEEKTGKYPRTKPAQWLTECVKIIFGETGKYPAIYTSPGYWQSYASKDPIILNCELHLAHWNTVKPIIPAPWTKYMMLQCAVKNEGRIYGVQTDTIDLSVWADTIESLFERAGLIYKDPASLSDVERLSRLEAIHTF